MIIQLKNVIRTKLTLIICLFASAGVLAQGSLASNSLIEPPKASQDGGAHLYFPIDAPADVGDIAPQIGVSYSNEGASSWVGYGWSLSSDAITLDTRWGIPQFDPDKETEIYQLGGFQLIYPKDYLPHRHEIIELGGTDVYTTELQNRTDHIITEDGITKKVLQPRRKTIYSIIERYGNDPTNYYWKVTHTNGSISWYGGDENGLQENYILRSGDNVSYWTLLKTVDRYGNFVKYSYQGAGTYTGSLAGGEYLYLSEIKYSGLQDEEGTVLREPNYSVKFSLSSDTRPDPVVNGRLGFKQVDGRKLVKIDVLQREGDDFRLYKRYVPQYSPGAFDKLLLERITEQDKAGNDFFTHEMSYYNEINLGFFDAPETVPYPSDIDGSLPLGVGSLLNSSALGQSQSSNWGWEFRPGVGLEVRPLILPPTRSSKRTFTIGSTFGESYSRDRGQIAMIDIDGNGLKDIVYRTSGGLKYKPHTEAGFGVSKNIANVGDFSKGKGKTKTMFLESFDFRSRIFGSYGRKRFKTRSKTRIYLTDGNGDMLPDIVRDGVVYFNYIDPVTNEPTFTTSSAPTENMLITASASLTEGTSEFEEDSIDMQMELLTDFDAVKVWIAPYQQKINIRDSIILHDAVADSEVRVTIEKYHKLSNTTTRVYEQILTASSPTANPFLQNVTVYKGDKIFFRIHKNQDAPNDLISSDPEIEIKDGVTLIMEENETPIDKFKYSEAFILSNTEGFIASAIGTASVTWNPLTISNMSDSLRFTVIKETINSTDGVIEEELFSQLCLQEVSTAVNPSGALTGIPISFTQDEQVSIKFRVYSDSNVKWTDTKWEPIVNFTPSDGSQATSERPVPEYTIYRMEETTAGQSAPIITLIENYNDWPNPLEVRNYAIQFNDLDPGFMHPEHNGEFTLVLKANQKSVAKRRIRVEEGGITLLDMNGNVNNSPISFFEGNKSDMQAENFRLYVQLYSEGVTGPILEEYIENDRFQAKLGYTVSSDPSEFIFIENISYYRFIHAYIRDYQYLGHNYHNWGQFYYNENNDPSSTPVDPIYGKVINNGIVDDPSSGVSSDLLASLGIDPSGYDNIDDLIDDIGGGLDIPADIATDTSAMASFIEDWENSFNSFSAFLPGIARRAVDASGTEEKQWEGFFDVQFHRSTQTKIGDFSQSTLAVIFSEEDAELPALEADLFTGMWALDKKYGSAAKSYNGGLFGLGLSTSESAYSDLYQDFMDLNGDKYPDLLYQNNVQITSMTGGHGMPLGDHFYGVVTNGDNSSAGLSGGLTTSYHDASQMVNGIRVSKTKAKVSAGPFSFNVSKNNPMAFLGTWAPGVSLNLDGSNEMKTYWEDINGDGLLDNVKKIGGSFKYQLNTGKYSSSSTYSAYELLNSDKSRPSDISVSASIPGLGSLVSGALSTLGLPIDAAFGIGASGSRVERTFVDINGDGLVDLLVVGDSDSRVHFNTGAGFNVAGTPLESINGTVLNLQAISQNIYVSAGLDVDAYFGTPVFTFWLPIPFCCVIPIFTIYVKFGASASVHGSYTIQDSKKGFMDFNGDGFTDYVKKEGGSLKVYLSKVGKTNMLKTVRSNLGDQFALDYDVTGNTYNMPMGKWVMSRIYYPYENTVDPGKSVHDDITYEDGYYDRREREFYGFETVKTARTNLRKEVLWTTINRYHNESYYLRSLMKQQYIVKGEYDSSSDPDYTSVPPSITFSKTDNKYELRPINDDYVIDLDAAPLPFDYDKGGTEGRSIAAPIKTKSTNYLYQYENQPIVTNTNYVSDQYARIVTEQKVEDGTTTKYFYPNDFMSDPTMSELVEEYSINIPIQVELFREEMGETIKVGTSKTTYGNAATALPVLLPKASYASKGEHPLERKMEYTRYDEHSNLIEAREEYGTPVSTLYGYHHRYPILEVKGITYDELEGLVDILNLQTLSNADNSAASEQALRDALLEARQLITNSNSALQVSANTYDPSFGVTIGIDGRGYCTYYEYDNSGRLLRVLDHNKKVLSEYEYNFLDD